MEEESKKYNQQIISANYNEEYFKNKSLAIINITLRSSIGKLEKIYITSDYNTLFVKTKIQYPETVTDDMDGRLILVEINKNITQIELEK